MAAKGADAWNMKRSLRRTVVEKDTREEAGRRRNGERGGGERETLDMSIVCWQSDMSVVLVHRQEHIEKYIAKQADAAKNS